MPQLFLLRTKPYYREPNLKAILLKISNKDQAVALATMGVGYLQGYYFDNPLKN